MKNKKNGVIYGILLILLISFSLVSAKLDVKTQTVSAMAIPELNLPAIFNLELTNNGETDTFNIDTRVVVDLEPKDSFTIEQGQTYKTTLKVYSIVPLRVSPDYLSLQYRINSQKSEVQLEELSTSLVDLKDAFDFTIENINPESEKAIVHFNNKAGHNFENVKLELSSTMLSQAIEFSLNAYEEKKLEVALNDKIKSALAGPYIVTAKIVIGNTTAETQTIMTFSEKANIQTSDTKSGWIIQKRTIEKKNTGNTKTEVSIAMTKNWFSGLFTSYNLPPSSRELEGLSISSIFKKELSPNESLIVIAKTNWLILILIIAGLVLIYYFVDNYIREKIVLKKSVHLVRTKGGEFALKVTINVKARDFTERIRVIDRLPPIVKVFEKYGLPPDKIDHANRRLEWNIQALSKGESRTLSYIMYSKIGVVGKFELPKAMSIYEYKGKIKEVQSNTCSFSKD